MKLTLFGYAFLGIILFSLWITRRIAKRRKTKLGCVGFGYIALVVFCVSMFSITLAYTTYGYMAKKTDILVNSKRYTAKVVDFREAQAVDSDGYTVTNYYPVLEFMTDDERTLTRTSDEPDISYKRSLGETRTIYYHEKKDLLTTIGAMTFITVIGLWTLYLGFLALFIGIIMYGFGRPMGEYAAICKNIGFKFLIPALMIAFDALLIYALFHGDTSQAWFVKPLLIIFIFGLSAGILGYIKMTIKKGIPTFRRVSDTQWEGDWEDE